MRVMSRWAAAALVVLAGCSAPTSPGDQRDPRPGAAAYDQFWQDFDRTYSYFEYKHIDWTAGRDEFRERAATAGNDSELVDVLLAAVTPLRDGHVWFRRPDGSTRPSYTPARQPNWDRDVWLGQLAHLGWRQGTTNWGWGRVGDVAYLAIGAWNTAQVKIDDVDAALEQLRDTEALVLDVRMNAGGNDALALQVAGRFASSSVRFGAVRFRNGPDHSDFGEWFDRTVSPRGAWQYDKPVYLLVGAGCFSSNETFIAAMRELPHVTVAGDTTGGSSGNPKEFALVVAGRDTHWKYSVPRWVEVLADGTVIEWNGIGPDVVVPFDSASVDAGRDPVLEWAFAQAGVALASSYLVPP
jgi:hypothetical protein